MTQKAESFKSQGILQPLVVRATPADENKYEVVAGARRLRAAQLAEFKTVPVRVVELTDAAAIEAQVVELSVVRKSFFADKANYVVYM